MLSSVATDSAGSIKMRFRVILLVIALIAIGGGGFVWLSGSTRESIIRILGGTQNGGDSAPVADPHDDHHGHDHAGHAEETSIELSKQARESVGLREGTIALTTYRRTIGVPGTVVERRGRSTIDIIAPMTGYVTQIFMTEGETVTPDQPLFELRLTHEELVQAQADLLKTAEELDVLRTEIARLEGIGPQGVIPAKTIIDRKYEQQKLEAILRAQRQSLLLHGLLEPQVSAIISKRTLLSTITVRAPSMTSPMPMSDDEVILQVQELRVQRGQYVNAGDSLAVLADHRMLLIEGEAFEQDIPQITQAAAGNFAIDAILETKSIQQRSVDNLHIAYVGNRIDAASRALHFYVTLPNQTVRDARTPEGQRVIEWRFKPGQRMQLRVPVEELPERIVLPSDAVAQEGLENYVFRVNGDHFDRQPVKVDHRDPQWVVVANDGSLFPGEKIAFSAAQQLQLALKNKSGGAIDPHAGHNH